MEFNATQHYRPSPNRPLSSSRPTSTQAPQMLDPYSSLPQQLQHQHHPQQMIQQTNSLSPYPTWTVPLVHSQYSRLQQTDMTPRDDYNQVIVPPDITVSSISSSNARDFRSLSGTEPFGGIDYFPGIIDTTPWGPKVCEQLESFPSLDADVTEFDQGLMHHDENTPIIDLRQYHGSLEQQETDEMAPSNPTSTRRMSESSFSMSSAGGAHQDVSSYDTITPIEAISYGSEYDPWSTLEPTPNPISPVASPRRPQHDSVFRSGGRSRASPAPHNNMRSSPYTLESSRFKRWSTGHAPTSSPASSRPLSLVQDRFAPYPPRVNPHHSMPAYTPSALSNFYGVATQPVLYQPSPLQSSKPAIFASPDQPFHLEVPRPLPSQGLFRLLQSNADRHGGCASHFADLSDPPDLYASLHEEPSNPPESDMNPSDPDLVPHEQDLRFNGDLYTPRWVRGHGNKREGWCGLCKPGRWLVLKNSAFWYDKSFTHGVSAATGAAFQGPQDTRRTEGNLDVWEGFCGSCTEWIPLVSSKKKGTTWFRHAYKCHTHPKVKDGPKRRRETHTVRARTASSASAASTSYPIKPDTAAQDSTTPSAAPSYSQSQAQKHQHSHSTAKLMSGPTAQQYVGMPTGPLPTNSHPAASFPIAAASTPLSSTDINVPLTDPPLDRVKQEPVVGLFGSPLQPLSTFSSPALRISEPELVGVKATPAFNNLAGMI